MLYFFNHLVLILEIRATKAEFKAEKPPVVVSDHEKADAKCPVDYEKMSTHVLLYGLRKVADLKRKISEKTNRYGKVQTVRIIRRVFE